MSRTYPAFDPQGLYSNFGVINRGSATSSDNIFVDRPQRSGVVNTASTVTAAGAVPISACQNNLLILGDLTTATGTFVLPEASDFLQAFGNLNIGSIVKFEVVNKGVSQATISAPAGSGAAAGLVNFLVPPTGGATGSRHIHLEFTQYNGSNTGPVLPYPGVATGAYLIY